MLYNRGGTQNAWDKLLTKSLGDVYMGGRSGRFPGRHV